MTRTSGHDDGDGTDPGIDSRRRRLLGTAAGASAAAVLPTTGSVGAESDDESVTIVRDTHFHGRFEDAEAAELSHSIESSDVLSEAEVVLASGQFQGPYVLDRLEERDTVADVDEPALRLFGGYDPDREHWDYGFDVPTSSGYEYFKLRADVSAAALTPDDDSNGSDGNESDDGTPGFGPLGALAGGSAGGYLYSRRRSADDDSPEASEPSTDGDED